MPLVSIITPAYNALPYIEKAIDSILGQSFSDFEFIICDDGSSDATLAYLHGLSDSRIRVISNPVNMGYLKTINKLFLETKGNFIAFMDADDWSHPRRLELQVDLLKRNETIGLVGTNYEKFDADGRCFRSVSMLEDSKEIKIEIKSRNVFQKPSIMFRSEVIKKIGGFREAFIELGNISEDYDWIMRALEYYDATNINYREPLYWYRSVSTSMSNGFTDINQLFGHKVVQFLATQRENCGADCLDTGNIEEVKSYIRKLRLPYEMDLTLFYREQSSAHMYAGLKYDAVKIAFYAIQKQPFRLINWRTLLYCLRH